MKIDKLDEQLQANLKGDFEKGWTLCQELAHERPNCNRCAFNRGWMLLQQGKLKEGFNCINRGRFENVFGSPPLRTNKPIWGIENPQSHNAKHILFRNEGGLGDEIINIRFVTDVKKLTNAKITVSCSEQFLSCFSRIEGIDSLITRNYEEFVHHDAWIPAMSAISCLDYEYENLSGKKYLSSIGNINLPNKKLKVGLRWAGNPHFEHEQFRKFPPSKLLEISNNFNDISFYSFQRDSDLIDLTPYPNVIDINKFLLNWEHTLTFLNDMDLVITSCTSIAHASAALGKPTWVITPILPYYIWALPGNKSPWYDSVKLYRQPFFDNWGNLFDLIEKDLNILVEQITKNK